MNNLFLLVACFVLGMGLQRTGRFPATTPAALNGFIIHLSLPALTLLHIHRLHLDGSLLYAAAMPWLLFALGAAFFYGAGRWARLNRATIGALMLVGGLGNTSFVGLPMIEAYYGKDFLSIGLIVDQCGSFLVLSTLGIATAMYYSGGTPNATAMARKILLFPPFQALVLGLLLRPVDYPDPLNFLLQRLGDTLTPLALISVGFQLRLGDLKGEGAALTLGLCYKLILGPLLIAGLYAGLLGARGSTLQVTIFEAAMAPMISAGIVAIDHDLNPRLVTLMIGLGIPLSFLTLPFWHRLLSGLG